MWNCPACHQAHADMRHTCPVFGTARPIKSTYRRSQEPEHGYCDVCGCGLHVKPVECEICDARLCRKHAKAHITACEHHSMELEMHYMDDLLQGRGLYGDPDKET